MCFLNGVAKGQELLVYLIELKKNFKMLIAIAMFVICVGSIN